jgi:hypothetical protein
VFLVAKLLDQPLRHAALLLGRQGLSGRAAPGSLIDGMIVVVAEEPGTPSVNTRLLDALVATQVITVEARHAAVREAVQSRAYVEDVLIDRGYVGEQRLLSCAADLDRVFFLPTRKLCSTPIDRELLSRVSGTIARSLCIFPVKLCADPNELVVATAQPTNIDALTRIRSLASVSVVRPLVARPSAIRLMITKYYALPTPPPSRRGPPN